MKALNVLLKMFDIDGEVFFAPGAGPGARSPRYYFRCDKLFDDMACRTIEEVEVVVNEYVTKIQLRLADQSP
jgi:hypothetical protein